MKERRQILGRVISALLIAVMLVGVIPISATGTWTADGAWESDGTSFKKIGELGTPSTITYDGTINFNTVSFDMKFGELWGHNDSNVGLGVYMKDGNNYFLELNPGQKYVRIRRFDPETWLAVENDTVTFGVDEWINVKFIFGNYHLEVIINDKSIVTVNDTGTDDLSTLSKVLISTWGAKPHIKNIKTSNTKLKEEKPMEKEWNYDAGWVESTEGSETVMTNTSWLSTIKHRSSDKGSYNTFSFDFRLNEKTTLSDCNISASIKVGESDSWLFEYNPAPSRSYVRLRWYPATSAEGTELSLKNITIADPDEWVNLKVVFIENYLLFYINNELMIAHFDTYGADMSTTLATVSTWNTGVSVKNLTVSNSEKDLASAGYIDLEFKNEDAVKSFTVSGGTTSYRDGALVLRPSSNNAVLTSPRINVGQGSLYSAKLGVRNTFAVRMKNASGATKLRVKYVTDESSDYASAPSKTFDIRPNSGWETYFFNISDIITCEHWKDAESLKACRCYLRGFSFEFEGEDCADGGEIEIDSITFEREDKIYEKAAETLSCVADPATKTVKVSGRLSAKYAGKTVVLYETKISNYNELLDHKTNKKIAEVKAGEDGSFEMTFPLYYKEGMSYLATVFLAEVEGVKLDDMFRIENWQDFAIENPYAPTIGKLSVKVTDDQFGAKGDGFTDDNAAIQAAIDYVSANGGGKVILPGDDSTSGRRYIAWHICLKDGVELVIEEGAVLWQSQRGSDYDYGDYEPAYGHNLDLPGVPWAHAAPSWNKPFLYLNEVKNVKITGGGEIRMCDTGSEWLDGNGYTWDSNIAVGCGGQIHIHPIAVWGSEYVEITDITIKRGGIWHVVVYNSSKVYLGNIDITEVNCINGDGFGIGVGTHDLILERCSLYSNDDSIVLGAGYNDPRGNKELAHPWWEANPSGNNCLYNITATHCNVFGGHGATFIPWGSDNPSGDKSEIYNVTITDCVLSGSSTAVGAWPDNPFYGDSANDTYNQTEADDYSPMHDITILNNVYDNITILATWQGAPSAKATNIITDCDIKSPSEFLNGSFDRDLRYPGEIGWTSGLSWWSRDTGESGSVGTKEIGQKQVSVKSNGQSATVSDYAGFIKGEGELFQGLYLKKGKHRFSIKTQLISGNAKVFARDAISGEIIVEKAVSATDTLTEVELLFKLDKATTVQLGVSLESGEVLLDDADVSIYNGEIPTDPVDPIDPKPVDPTDPIDPNPTEPIDPEPEAPKTGINAGLLIGAICAAAAILGGAAAVIVSRRRKAK